MIDFHSFFSPSEQLSKRQRMNGMISLTNLLHINERNHAFINEKKMNSIGIDMETSGRC